MARLRITGSGMAANAYTFELDGVPRSDVLKAVITWDGGDVVTADLRLYVEEVEVDPVVDQSVMQHLAERSKARTGSPRLVVAPTEEVQA